VLTTEHIQKTKEKVLQDFDIYFLSESNEHTFDQRVNNIFKIFFDNNLLNSRAHLVLKSIRGNNNGKN
jgi:hypothetical protein